MSNRRLMIRGYNEEFCRNLQENIDENQTFLCDLQEDEAL